MKIQCQNPRCQKFNVVDEDAKYCRYCATSFALYGIDVPKLFVKIEKAEKERDMTYTELVEHDAIDMKD